MKIAVRTESSTVDVSVLQDGEVGVMKVGVWQVDPTAGGRPKGNAMSRAA